MGEVVLLSSRAAGDAAPDVVQLMKRFVTERVQFVLVRSIALLGRNNGSEFAKRDPLAIQIRGGNDG